MNYAMELADGVVQLAQQGQQGVAWKKLLAEAKEIYEKNRQAIKQEIAIQKFIETVKGV
ncbi:hypothetical protein [Crassaminicella thermophila]|uniref:hypothetical protein n=1 Tax=Crassaminicella thermophila TaxID=2599308 RepID=UPI00143D0DCD|nr:hypothetical protein [Crassaminicella thermophila]